MARQAQAGFDPAYRIRVAREERGVVVALLLPNWAWALAACAKWQAAQPNEAWPALSIMA